LQAASASEPPINTTVTTLRTMIISAYKNRNDHGADQVALSTVFAAELTSAAAPRTVLQAAIAIELPIRAMVITLRSMAYSPV
jgi:hypothetical protein